MEVVLNDLIKDALGLNYNNVTDPLARRLSQRINFYMGLKIYMTNSDAYEAYYTNDIFF